MNKYSKIKLVNNHHKSRSIDFADLTTFPKITTTKPTESKPRPKDPKITNTPKSPDQQDEENKEKNQDFNNGSAEPRNNSIFSNTSSSHRFRIEKERNNQATSLEDAVRRAFSVRRSSSVSEKYSRIHDQGFTLSSSSPLDEDNYESDNYVRVDNNTRSMAKKKKHSRIIKACKRFFGM